MALQEIVHHWLDYDGEYYKEMIKSRYNVTENNKLLDRITMGRVTVN